MSQPLVLAIEPDLRQAAIVKRIVRENALADVVVVDSRDAAIDAIRKKMPDVLLLSALLSPRDEDELMAHLKTLDNSGHLQTHTIPQLASTLEPGEERASRGLLSAFRRKKEAAPVPGCDPDLFADEIRLYLRQAADKKQQRHNMSFVASSRRPETADAAQPAASENEEPAAPASSWSSPFEWKPSGSSPKPARPREEAPVRKPTRAPAPEPVATAPAIEPPSLIKPAAEEPLVARPAMAEAVAKPVVETPAPVAERTLIAESVVQTPAPVVERMLVADPVVTPAPVTRPLVSERVGQLVEPPPAKKSAKPAEAPRPKAVADRPVKLAERVPLRDLIRKQDTAEDAGDLGPVARWARSDAPRAVKGAAVTSDDVRALISSLAVPSAVAAVTYPRGVRLRRVRVPLSSDQEGAAQASA